MQIEWNELKQMVLQQATERQISQEHQDRLKFELKEIEKQGATAYYVRLYNDGYKYETNKNGLVLPWLLDMTPVDPLTSKHNIQQQTDWPDIDVDCIPSARDHIKAFAAQEYGADKTCSVGTWMTYKFRSAIQDVARVISDNGETNPETGESLHKSDPVFVKEAVILTTALPDEVDDLKDGGIAPCVDCKTKHNALTCPKCGSDQIDGITIGKLLNDYENLRAYNEKHPEVIDMAVRLVGKIKSLGTHAGGLIISSVPLFGNIPMSYDPKTGRFLSMWTEGRNTQLSKFGFVKWDILGLKTLQYIHDCCEMIKETRGCVFDAIPWSRQDKDKNILGTYKDASGNDQYIKMDDQAVFDMLNELRTETVFQFETDVQRGILSNGIRDYYDLQVFNAMGHPGPMDMIPEYVKRRDDIDKNWKQDERKEIAEMLEETHGIIVYQEQLAALWMKFAGFTSPEAEAARKAVAKKWKEKLKPVREQWIKGASKVFGVEYATMMWDDRMEPFGRYAFNKSHSTAYIMEAYMTAWLKIHFAPEWWASVMSSCHHEKLVKYMNIARSEGVKFGPINVEHMAMTYTVEPATLTVTPGLISIKGIGEGVASKLKLTGKYSNIDEFIEANGKSKTILQRLILLGAFQRYHPNIRATWMWYQYKYGDDSAIKKDIRAQLLSDWTQERIETERKRQKDEFIALNPKKKKIPAKILNWQPKPNDTREAVMSLFPEDYTIKEKLKFEKEYLGYYWHSPMDDYKTVPGTSIKDCKEGNDTMQAIIENVWTGKTKNGKQFAKVTVTDGLATATVLVWEKELNRNKGKLIEGAGIELAVSYDSEHNSFTIGRNADITRLKSLSDYYQEMKAQHA